MFLPLWNFDPMDIWMTEVVKRKCEDICTNVWQFVKYSNLFIFAFEYFDKSRNENEPTYNYTRTYIYPLIWTNFFHTYNETYISISFRPQLTVTWDILLLWLLLHFLCTRSHSLSECVEIMCEIYTREIGYAICCIFMWEKRIQFDWTNYPLNDWGVMFYTHMCVWVLVCISLCLCWCSKRISFLIDIVWHLNFSHICKYFAYISWLIDSISHMDSWSVCVFLYISMCIGVLCIKMLMPHIAATCESCINAWF